MRKRFYFTAGEVTTGSTLAVESVAPHRAVFSVAFAATGGAVGGGDEGDDGISCGGGADGGGGVDGGGGIGGGASGKDGGRGEGDASCARGGGSKRGAS